jgi:hypothetical protein
MAGATMQWSEVARLLEPWRNYWLCTTGTDGGPHAAPVWGVVEDEVLYFFTESGTVKARNLAADPRLLVHSESGDDVVVVRGSAQRLGLPAGHPGLVAAFAAKYDEPGDAPYLPAATDSVNEFYAVRPTQAMAWLLDEYEGSQRRWAAAPPEPTIISDPSS